MSARLQGSGVREFIMLYGILRYVVSSLTERTRVHRNLTKGLSGIGRKQHFRLRNERYAVVLKREIYH